MRWEYLNTRNMAVKFIKKLHTNQILFLIKLQDTCIKE